MSGGGFFDRLPYSSATFKTLEYLWRPLMLSLILGTRACDTIVYQNLDFANRCLDMIDIMDSCLISQRSNVFFVVVGV